VTLLFSMHRMLSYHRGLHHATMLDVSKFMLCFMRCGS